MEERKDDELYMTFNPNTIQHLGIKMYSHLPTAIAELVANSYDACANEVKIKLYDDEDGKRIIVEDNGNGMSFFDLNHKFLIIGRNRREEGFKETKCGRIASGKKGLGKLALFGIGGSINIKTKTKEDQNGTEFTLIWDEIKHWNREEKGPDYKPLFKAADFDSKEKGTDITISNLKRSTGFSEEYKLDMAKSLAGLFNFLDDTFKIKISFNDGEFTDITNDLKYDSLDIQFRWKMPEFAIEEGLSHKYLKNFKGEIVTINKPLSSKKKTGITLYAHGRRVNVAEFFGHSESSNFFSYTVGWINVDFVDDEADDLISTDRKSIDWEAKGMNELRILLKQLVSLIHKDWRAKRKEADIKESEETTGINKSKWFSTIPNDKASDINDAIEKISNPDSHEKPTEILVKAMHKIVPEYAELHWRYLNPEIHYIAEHDYKQKEYFRAAKEASSLYQQRVRELSGLDTEKMDLLFNPGNGILMVTDCSDETEKNIQTGHQFLSQGIISGCRNPLIHNPDYQHLIESGLFDEKVCLDMLATISHLFTRLDKAKKREQQ